MRDSLRRTWLFSHVKPLFPIKGATETKVVSRGTPWRSIGIVLSSMPMWAKSCSALLPALAPK